MLRVFSALFLSLMLASSAFAGQLDGRVADRSGAVLAGATILLTNVATGASAEVVTSTDGRYRFSDLAVGIYRVVASFSGFSDVSRTIVVADASQQLTADFELDLGPIGQVNTANSPTITLSATVGFEFTLGVNLGDVSGANDLTTSTDLTDLPGVDDLADVIQSEFALTPANPPEAVFTLDPDEFVEFQHQGAAIAADLQVEFSDNGANSDTISRTSGSWFDDGFREGQTIRIAGSGSNDGVFEIHSVSALTLTLTPDADIDTETKTGT